MGSISAMSGGLGVRNFFQSIQGSLQPVLDLWLIVDGIWSGRLDPSVRAICSYHREAAGVLEGIWSSEVPTSGTTPTIGQVSGRKERECSAHFRVSCGVEEVIQRVLSEGMVDEPTSYAVDSV